MRPDWLTFPNFLSAARVLVLPWTVLALRAHDRPVLLGLVLFVAATDFLDGWLARRLGVVSDFGKLLDPLADKICAMVCFVALVAYTDFPAWGMVLILVKDLLIAAGGAFITRREKLPITPNFWGKAATCLEIITFTVFAFELKPLMTDALAVMAGFIVLSFLTYVGVFVEVLRRPALRRRDRRRVQRLRVAPRRRRGRPVAEPARLRPGRPPAGFAWPG